MKRVKVQSSAWLEEDDLTAVVPSINFDRRESATRNVEPSLSFATQIGECKPMEGEEEIDKLTFDRWHGILESAMALAGITEESVKANIFKMKAGYKLLDLLDGTSIKNGPDAITHPYTNAIHRIQEYFGSREYVLFQRQKLRSMPQGAGESDLRYVRCVAGVAKLCGYVNEQLMETVADVIQHHADNRLVRDVARKAARKGSSLQELMDWVRSTEIEKQAEEIYKKIIPSKNRLVLWQCLMHLPLCVEQRRIFVDVDVFRRIEADSVVLTDKAFQ